MVGIVVTGHGHFPEGLLSAVELVAGTPGNVAEVNFEGGQSSDDLKRRLTKTVTDMETDEILILADLVGGTPFNQSVILKQEMTEKTIQVIAGTNLAILVEAVFSRSVASLKELVKLAKTAGAAGIVDADDLNTETEEPEFEDGL